MTLVDTSPRWPAGWPPAGQIYAELPLLRTIDDITAAGELLAAAGFDPDWLQFFQIVVISGESCASTALTLIDVCDADYDDEP